MVVRKSFYGSAILFLFLSLLLLGKTDLAGAETLLVSCARCEHSEEMYHSLHAEVTSPVIIRRTAPVYPEEMHSVQGTVILQVTVLPDGDVGYIEVKRSVPQLDSLAVKTVQGWEFYPALRGDEPVIGFLIVEVEFNPIQEQAAAAKSEDVVFLRSEIARFLSDKREIKKHSLLKIPYPLYSENYHLFSPFRQETIIRRNGFTIIPGYTTSSRQLQTEFPFFETTIALHRIDFKTEQYDLPVTLVDAYLGLGNLDMNYGHLSIMKNDLFELENLQFIGGYITEDGYWMGDDGVTAKMLNEEGREKRTDFMADLYYPWDNYALRWTSFITSQRSPAVKYRFLNAPDTLHINRESAEHSLYFSNPYVDLGLRYENVSYETESLNPERTLLQLRLNRALTIQEHKFRLSWEMLQAKEKEFSSYPYFSYIDNRTLTDEPEHIFSFLYYFDASLMYLKADILSGMGYKYLAASEAGFHLNRTFDAGFGYIEKEPVDDTAPLLSMPADLFVPGSNYYRQDAQKDIYAVMRVTPYHYEQAFLPEVNLYLGQQEIHQNSFNWGDAAITTSSLKTLYLKADYHLSLNTGKVEWGFYGITQYYHDTEGIWFLPQLFARNTLELKYLLPYNNTISTGVVHHFTSDFDRPTATDDTETIDAFVRISITDKFDIQADVMNITDSKTLFGVPHRAGLHFNAGIRWLFFN